MFKPLFADDSPKQLPIEPEKTPAPSRTLDHRFSGAHPISSSSFVHLLAILLVALSTWRWGNNDKDLQGPTMIETFRATMIETFKATMIETFKAQQSTASQLPLNLAPYPQCILNGRETLQKSLKQWSPTILFVGKTFCWKRRKLLSLTSDKNWKIQRSCREVMQQQSILKTVKS